MPTPIQQIQLALVKTYQSDTGDGQGLYNNQPPIKTAIIYRLKVQFYNTCIE